jgi:hypothetical protein
MAIDESVGQQQDHPERYLRGSAVGAGVTIEEAAGAVSRRFSIDRAATSIASGLLVVFVLLVLTAGAQKSETIDEGLFIAGGAAQVASLNPNIDLSHPPLLRWVSGLPVVFIAHANVPEPIPFTQRKAQELYADKIADVFAYGVRFFYDAGNRPERMLFWGRAPFALIGALMVWLVFRLTRRYFGSVPALGAMSLLAFTPEMLAHSQWAHSDVASALTLVLVALALANALSTLAWRPHVLLALALGLAVATKLTALLLWPPVLLLVGIAHRRSLGTLAARIAAGLVIFYATIVVSYLPDTRLLGPHYFVQSDLDRAGLTRFEPVLRWTPLPNSFLQGAVYTKLLSDRGQISYLRGETSVRGWWYYFPVAIFLKYPTTTLLLAVIGLYLFWRSPLPFEWRVAFTVPPAVILVAAMTQSINIGVRSVLPLAPFMAVWAGAAIAAAHGRVTKLLTGAALLLSCVSGVWAYPDFLAYFNPLSGGTRQADKWLVDSNLDWGQDLPALATELKRRGVEDVHLAYFGMGRPSYYGIRTLDSRSRGPGWYAISRSYLSGWWPRDDPYAWLRTREPVAIPGGSIALFYVAENEAPATASDREAELMEQGLEALHVQHDAALAADYFQKVLARNSEHYGATYQLAVSLDRLERSEEARVLWFRVLGMAEGYRDEQTAATARRRIEHGGSR